MKRPIALLAAAVLVGGSLVLDGAVLAQGRSRAEAERGSDRGNERRETPQIRERQAPQMRDDRDFQPYPIQSGEQRNTEQRTYTPPPQQREQPAPAPARRGGYLPPAAGGGPVSDLNRYQLRPPPPGYAWVRVNGGFALVSRATGQIFDIVPN